MMMTVEEAYADLKEATDMTTFVDEVYADRPNLALLIPAVAAAKRADREIDRVIMRIAHVWEARHIGATCDCCPDGKHLDHAWVDPVTDCWVTTAENGFEFTSSVDRVLAAIRKRLPKYHSSHGWEAPDGNGLRRYYARLTHDRKPRDTGLLYGRSEPLALCHAYLMGEFLETAAALEGPRP